MPENIEFVTRGLSASALVQVDDAQLIDAARRHENAAIEALMRRYNRRLFRVARSILRDAAAAEDAVQECYVRAFTKLDRYQPTGSFGAWLTRIAINESLMLKRRVRHTFVSLEDCEHQEGDRDHEELSTADPAQATSVRQLLELAVDALPQPFRTVFMLRVVEQLSVAETAASLDLNEATVKTRLHRAQTRLREDITRRLEREHLTLFEFAGAQCDRIVARVLLRLTRCTVDSSTTH